MRSSAILLVCLLEAFLRPLQAKSSKSAKYKIDVLLPFTKGLHCDQFVPSTLPLVEAFIYKMDKINLELDEKINLTLDYGMLDSCSRPQIAIQETLKLVTHNTSDDNRLVAVMGPVILENIIFTAGILHFHRVPQVSTLF